MTNLGAMNIGAFVESERLHGSTLLVPEIETLCADLTERSLAERLLMPGLDSRRADIILGGGILLLHALAHIDSERIEICTRGLRWGVLYDRFLPNPSNV